jgi:hypothetical protein
LDKEELITIPTTLAQAVKILASIWEVTGSNLGWDSDYPDI